MIGKFFLKLLKKNSENKIYIKEIRPEMTQCRIIQIDKRKIKWEP